MPYIQIWIHAVWSTHSRLPLLNQSIRQDVFQHIVENGRKKGLIIDRVSGYIEHVHMLFALPGPMPLSKAIQLVKGESSHWINQSKATKTKFEWQDEYYAASVSESGLDAIRTYIDNQEVHHCHRTFQEEYDDLLKSIEGKKIQGSS
jgi:REP element-mobilizing transposase RayT